MAESEAIQTLRMTVEKYLSESFGNYLRDQKNNYIIQAGSAQIIIVPSDWINNQTILKILAVINIGAKVTPDLTRYLATENLKILFGKLALDEKTPAIYLEHNLLGDFLNRKELEVAVLGVGVTADKYDNEIKDKFGGKMLGEF